MLIHGHERWHPSPISTIRSGGGPLFDMGPYYLTALVSLLGPVRRVTGSTRMTFPERTIRSGPRAGERIKVEVPTHLAAVLDFVSGPIATLVTSFDVWASQAPKLEIYGSQGSLGLPDPNTFGGPVRMRGAGKRYLARCSGNPTLHEEQPRARFGRHSRWTPRRRIPPGQWRDGLPCPRGDARRRDRLPREPAHRDRQYLRAAFADVRRGPGKQRRAHWGTRRVTATVVESRQ